MFDLEVCKARKLKGWSELLYDKSFSRSLYLSEILEEVPIRLSEVPCGCQGDVILCGAEAWSRGRAREPKRVSNKPESCMLAWQAIYIKYSKPTVQ